MNVQKTTKVYGGQDMKKIIGGLLVVSLLSGPAAVKVNLYAYELIKNQHQIIYVLKKNVDPRDKITKAADVDEAMKALEQNTRTIKTLLKDKNRIVGKIQTALDLRAYAKSPLDESQVNAFADFTALYAEEGGQLQDALTYIDDNKDLMTAKKEILHNQTDYEVVLREINAISDSQSNAIDRLTNIIGAGEAVLTKL